MSISRVDSVTWRPYRRDESDWWQIRDLLVQTHAHVSPGWNWDIRHWDGQRFHRVEPHFTDELAAGVGLWFEGERLVGALHSEYGADAVIELDPDYRNLEPAMVGWAEQVHAEQARPGAGPDFYVWDYDLPRQRLLAEHGYHMQEEGGWLHRMRFDRQRGQPPSLPPGYRLSTTSVAGAESDAAKMADLLNAAFGRSIHTAAEYARFMAESPSFRHDLNLVAVSAAGEFACHVGLTYDDVNRHGIVEPVCTHPEHRRRGLARSLIGEGVRRLGQLDALTANVESGDGDAANALYRKCGFSEGYRAHVWRRPV